MTERIGPGKPPKSGRFRKGQSGNPGGRPRKAGPASTTASAFNIIVDRTLTITRDGMAREVTVEEALQHRTYQAAIAGDRAAGREVLKMIAKREAELAKRPQKTARKIDLKAEAPDPGNANPAMLLLGIVCEDPGDFGAADIYERLLLEPWAVQAALSRRRGGAKLTAREVEEIRRCTRDPGSLRWPRGTDR